MLPLNGMLPLVSLFHERWWGKEAPLHWGWLAWWIKEEQSLLSTVRETTKVVEKGSKEMSTLICSRLLWPSIASSHPVLLSCCISKDPCRHIGPFYPITEKAGKWEIGKQPSCWFCPHGWHIGTATTTKKSGKMIQKIGRNCELFSSKQIWDSVTAENQEMLHSGICLPKRNQTETLYIYYT